MKKDSSSATPAALFIVLAAILWSADGLLRRSLYSLPPLVVVTLEHLVALVALLPVILIQAKRFKSLTKTDQLSLSWVSLMSGVLGTVLYTAALGQIYYIPFSVVVLLQQTQPLFVLLSARRLLKEVITPKLLGWIALAMMGAYAVSFKHLTVNVGTDLPTIKAALMAIGAAAAWGSSTAFSKRLLKRLPVIQTTTYRFVLTTIIGILGIGVFRQQAGLSQVTMAQIGTLAIIACSTGLVAMLIYYRGLKQVPAKVSAVLELTWPLSAMALDAIILKNPLTITQYAGAALLLFAMYRVTKTTVY